MIRTIRSVFWTGVAMLILSFLGVPQRWKMIVFAFAGALLVASALRLRAQYRAVRAKLRNLEHHGA